MYTFICRIHVYNTEKRLVCHSIQHESVVLRIFHKRLLSETRLNIDTKTTSTFATFSFLLINRTVIYVRKRQRGDTTQFYRYLGRCLSARRFALAAKVWLLASCCGAAIGSSLLYRHCSKLAVNLNTKKTNNFV